MRTQATVLGAALAVLVLVISIRSFGDSTGNEPSQTARAVENRPLIFRDGEAGDILVFDKRADKPFAILKRDKNSFIANTVRLLAAERMRRGAGGRDKPFLLTLWSDGRLSFADPSTGETIELVAFGATNVQSFARLLPGNTRL